MTEKVVSFEFHVGSGPIAGPEPVNPIEAGITCNPYSLSITQNVESLDELRNQINGLNEMLQGIFYEQEYFKMREMAHRNSKSSIHFLFA